MPPPLVRTFSFTTVTLDKKGKEKSREAKQSRYFSEDLGNGVTLEMVEIPGGSFTMGSPANEADRDGAESPQHPVSLLSFWMGKFEVTQKQWQAVMDNNPSSFKENGNLPVENVSWDDAQAFLINLNAKLGLKDRSKQYRLPSEAEWEYAARAGTATPFTFGDTITPQIVNYDGNHPYANAPKGTYRQKTVPVGSLGAANVFGLFDMHGNVHEWCEDVWHDSYGGQHGNPPMDGSAWLHSGDSSRRVRRVLRGGSWSSNGRYCRSASRNVNPAGLLNGLIGFRVVLSSRTQ